MAYPLEHHDVATNGVRLHVVQCGPADGPLVVLLHGFPEFWWQWRKYFEPLAEAGYRVWAPDQRGYNLSDRPPQISAYTLDALAGDVAGLIDAAGREQACVVGHDWGAAVAWWLALTRPERVRRMTIINVPHPAVMLRALRSSPRQLTRSWYMFVFQLPWLPEAMFRFRNFRALARGLQKTSRPGTFSDADLDEYRRAWSQPGAPRGMVNWYRAAFRYRSKMPRDPRVRVPTLIVWGARDRFLGRELAAPSLELCDSGRLEMIEEATHWTPHEEPQRMLNLMTTFFSEE